MYYNESLLTDDALEFVGEAGGSGSDSEASDMILFLLLPCADAEPPRGSREESSVAVYGR